MGRSFLRFVIGISFFTTFLYQSSAKPAKVLIFSRTVDFRHDSIPTAIDALMQQGSPHNIEFDKTEDQTFFVDSNLSKYDALLFLSNTGQVLDNSGVNALQHYVNSGGNFVAIHSASDCLRNSTFFGNQLGAHFRDHANLQNATILVVNSSHPSTSSLPQRWAVQDEMYHFKSDPRSIGAVVLLAADTSTFTDQTSPDMSEGSPSPKAWYQEHGAGASVEGADPFIGRSWYTSLGHLNETWQDSTFMAHIMGGITWALASNTTLAFNANGKVGNGVPPPSASTIPDPQTQQSGKSAAMKAYNISLAVMWCMMITLCIFSTL